MYLSGKNHEGHVIIKFNTYVMTKIDGKSIFSRDFSRTLRTDHCYTDRIKKLRKARGTSANRSEKERQVCEACDVN